MNVGNRADNLQSDLLELIFRELSVIDRLACDGVNRHWKAVMVDRCWSTTKKLDREVVLSGATDRQKERFNSVPLFALVRRVHANLVELDLASFEDDAHHINEIDSQFEAMLEGCSSLRSIRIGRSPWSEPALLKLAKLPNLVELEFSGYQCENFTDAVLMAIAERGQLKKLVVSNNYELTDRSISYLIQHCKSLVTLNVVRAIKLTDVSLCKVITEVERRYGSPPPRELPTGPLDPRIFYFPVKGPEPGFMSPDTEWAEMTGNFDVMAHRRLFGRNGIDWQFLPTDGNPWLVTDPDSRQLAKRKLF